MNPRQDAVVVLLAHAPARYAGTALADATTMLQDWTSPHTFGNPQCFFLVVLVTLLAVAAIFGVVTVVREVRAIRTSRRA